MYCQDMDAIPTVLSEILKQQGKSQKLLDRCREQGHDKSPRLISEWVQGYACFRVIIADPSDISKVC